MFENLKNFCDSFLELDVPGFDLAVYKDGECILRHTNGYSDIEILPYHKMGEHKYEALGIKCFEYAIPEKENIEKYKKILNI